MLSHAHLDHSGALPLLVKQGFRGPIFATPSAIELCKLLLPDSGRLQEEDAAYSNRHHLSKHQPALPLYTEEDAERCLKRFEPLAFEQAAQVAPGLTATLRPAGHILGAASVELAVGKRVLLFSGDLGRNDDPVMRSPVPIRRADWIVVESTYGDRSHEAFDGAQTLLGEAINRTASRGGMVVIPAFAVGRAQLLLHLIHQLKKDQVIADLPVFLDSPMAVDSTEIYHRHHAEHRLSDEDCAGMYKAAKMVRTAEESKALRGLSYPSVIVSASGMATGGRVLHHLKALAPDRRNTIVLAGFQAGGTRGARLQAGERMLRIHGEEVPVRAEVVSLPGLSAHADAGQILDWLRSAPKPPLQVFITHGEPGPADALRLRIEHELKWDAEVPLLGQQVELVA